MSGRWKHRTQQRFSAPMLSAAADRIPHGAIIMSDPTSTHKVAAVTDGMRGIGQGIVVALPQRDFDVVVCDRTIDPAIAERMTTNAPPGAHLSFAKNELVDPADLPRFVYAIFAAFVHIECLVNNAGISAKSRGDLLDVSAESYDLNFTVNTLVRSSSPRPSARRCSQPRANFRKARARYIHILLELRHRSPERGEYAMTKAAVAMISFSSRLHSFQPLGHARRCRARRRDNGCG